MVDKTSVWFVTGAGRGLGRAVVRSALAAGDRVVGTARKPEVLDDLMAEHGDRLVVLALDVDDRADVFLAVERAIAAFERIDVVVNNAGYGLMGATEEISEAEARAQMDTNFFGTLWVTQAVLPHLRTRGSGHIVQMSSVGGIGTFPTLGMYNASKWALEGFSEALAQEVAPFGIAVTIVEPGGFATDWAGSSMRFAERSPAYDPLRAQIMGGGGGSDGAEGQPEQIEGDPAEVADAVLELVRRPRPPLRRLVGADAFDAARVVFERRRDDYRRDPRFTWPC
jgi:NAD(P)-dependent dehydrogenase (short-subunit alcohol dehydrogenase family)